MDFNPATSESRKADLHARLPALIELKPVTYRFRGEDPRPIAAEDPVEYGSKNK